MRTRTFALILAAGLTRIALGQADGGAAQPSPIPDPDPNQKMETTIRVVAPAMPAPGAANVATADDLLTLLENAGKDLRTFQADIRKTRIFDEIEGGGTHEQGGKLIFVSDLGTTGGTSADGTPVPSGPQRRKFAVTFDYTIFDGKTKNTDEQTFIFDGEWLTEINAQARQIHRRQVVPPGEVMDPLAVGEGPFPLPIGQKRAKILERFEVELLPPDKFDAFRGADGKPGAPMPGVLSETWQLRLTPRPEFRGEYRLTEARIWYRKDNFLPRMAWTKEKDGSSNEYFLTATRENEPVPDGAFEVKKRDGWTEQVDPFRRERTDK